MGARKILISTGDLGLWKGLAQALRDRDHDVIACDSREVDVEGLECEGIVAAVIDLDTCQDGGLRVCHRFADRNVIPRIPVILVAGEAASMSLKLNSFKQGATDLISKPVEPDELAGKLDAVLRGNIWLDIGQGEPSSSSSLESIERDIALQGLEHMGTPVALLDRCGRACYQNAQYRRLFSLKPGQYFPAQLQRQFFVEKEAWDRMWATVLGGSFWEEEVWIQSSDEEQVAKQCRADPVLSEERQLLGAAIHFQDITYQKHLETNLAYHTTRDPLTQLHNRHFFEEALEHAVASAAHGHPYSLIYLDLNHFKLINDTFKHQAGDRVLMEVARLLRENVRTNDQIARLGGDEFAVILEDASTEDAVAIVKQLLEAFRRFKQVEGEETVTVSASVGIAKIGGESSGEEVLLRADTACYVAKRRPQEAFVVYTEADAEIRQFKQEASWSIKIDKALQENRFELWAQPIIALDGSKLPFFEILLRLRDISGEMILPGQIIPAAERFGKITAIDAHITRKAIECLQNHPEHDFRLAVNLSGRSLSESHLGRQLQRQLEESSVKAHRLTLEITETAMIENFDLACEAIRDLKGVGCLFALDDFGSGFSTLNHLRRLPVDFLKLDMELVHGLSSDEVDRSLVRSVNEIARTLKKATIAEGVEDHPTLKWLKDLGTQHAQGFYFARPRPVEEVIEEHKGRNNRRGEAGRIEAL